MGNKQTVTIFFLNHSKGRNEKLSSNCAFVILLSLRKSSSPEILTAVSINFHTLLITDMKKEVETMKSTVIEN